MDRQRIILEILEERSSVTVAELSEILKISDVTVRKVLTEMEAGGLLKRTWGGAVSLFGSQRELLHSQKAVRHVREKKLIARRAMRYIHNEDAIFLDSGSTNTEFARCIEEYCKATPGFRLTVGTNAINIAYQLANVPGVSVIMIGGEVRGNALSCIGPIAEDTLRTVFFDKGFVSAYCCTARHGLTTPNAHEAHFKRCMMAACKENFLLIDHSKFGNDTMMHICRVEDIDCLITDAQISPDELEQIRSRCDNVVVVAPEEELDNLTDITEYR